MPSPELFILDVGHGNCAVLKDTAGVLIVDCPQGSVLLEMLEASGIMELEYIVISHADEDHVAGVLALLSHEQIRVKKVFINPDATKRTRVWTAVLIALEDAFQRSGTRARLGITIQDAEEFELGEVMVEVLSPSVGEGLSGPGGRDTSGEAITTNSASIVLGFVHRDHRVALLAGDMDDRTLRRMRERCSDIRADILVYPHHGGSAGRENNEEFAQVLCGSIQPRLVVLSLSRERFDNPREDVVRGIRRGAPNTHIMCTELAKACADDLPVENPSHLTVLPAKGRETRSCCGGSIYVQLNGPNSRFDPQLAAHLAFVSINAPTARCLRRN
jgi:beta-lactamase superfamily II metal-dependent hydrolase